MRNTLQSDVHDQLRAVIERYLSPIMTDSVLAKALREAGLTAATVTAADIDTLLPRLERGFQLFVAAGDRTRLESELGALSSGGSKPQSLDHVVEIRHENDVSTARLLARSICETIGGRSMIAQRVATAVSELARNIVSYTPGGRIELSVLAGPKRIRVVAEDRGSGIPDLDAIMTGRYRSKTGMGKGIVGVSRLSDRFEITRTGIGGTRIEIEVNV